MGIRMNLTDEIMGRNVAVESNKLETSGIRTRQSCGFFVPIVWVQDFHLWRECDGYNSPLGKEVRATGFALLAPAANGLTSPLGGGACNQPEVHYYDPSYTKDTPRGGRQPQHRRMSRFRCAFSGGLRPRTKADAYHTQNSPIQNNAGEVTARVMQPLLQVFLNGRSDAIAIVRGNLTSWVVRSCLLFITGLINEVYYGFLQNHS